VKSIQQVRSEEAGDWDRNAEFYRDDDAFFLMQDLARRREEFYGIAPGRRVLDLGCGSGAVVAQLRAGGVDAAGVDYSAAMVAVAHEEFGLGEHVARADASDLPFEDNSFDVVMANGVFHHLAVQHELAGSLREVFRVLRPGGRLCCFDRNGGVVSNLMTFVCIGAKELLRIVTRRERFASCASRNEIPFGSAADLKAIAQHGFRITRRRDVSTLPMHLAVVMLNALQYFVSQRLRWTIEGRICRLLSWIDTVCSWHWFCVEQFVVFETCKQKSLPAAHVLPQRLASVQTTIGTPLADEGEQDAVGF